MNLLLFTGVQHEFDFTTSCNVLKENTLQYLSEGWETISLLPSPLPFIPPKSSLEESVKKMDTDDTQSVTANEFFIDDCCVLSVSHEEEIVTTHNAEGLNLEIVQSKESDGMKKSVNLCELGVSHGVKSTDVGNHRSVGKASLGVTKAETGKNFDIKMANHVEDTDKVLSLGSLLGVDFCVRTEGNDVPVHTNQSQAEEELSLKHLLSGTNSHDSGNDNIKSVETFGCDTIMSKVPHTALPTKCEVIRPVKTGMYTMMQTVGSEDGAAKSASVNVHANAAEFAGQKETIRSTFKTDISVKMEQQSLPVNSMLTGTGEHIQISAKTVPGKSLEPHVAGKPIIEDIPDGNLGVQPQMSLKEENGMERNLKLDLSAVWEGTDDSNINITTPDVEFLLKQSGNFDLIAYLFSSVSALTSHF